MKHLGIGCDINHSTRNWRITHLRGTLYGEEFTYTKTTTRLD